MIDIKVDRHTCIRCAKCVRICPVFVFGQKKPKADIDLTNIESCFSCGHCIAACPTDSVTHTDFPKEKVHEVNRGVMPSPEQLMELLRSRRSNRAIRKAAIPQSMLNMIVEAASLAPTARNAQNVSFTLITNPEILNQVIEYTTNIFEGVIKNMSDPSPMRLVKEMIDLTNKGVDKILHGAKALLLIHTPESSRYGLQDANLAYQNGSLMAESLGVTQFYTGFVCSAATMDPDRGLEKMLGIEGVIHAGMALGMPLFKFPKYIDRAEVKLTRL